MLFDRNREPMLFDRSVKAGANRDRGGKGRPSAVVAAHHEDMPSAKSSSLAKHPAI